MPWKYTIDEKFVLTSYDEDGEIKEKIADFLNKLGTNCLRRREVVVSWTDPETSKKKEYNEDGTPKTLE